MVKTLADYPRLNIQKDLLKLPNAVKVKAMFEIASKFHLYFLVLMPIRNVNYFWLGRYEDISIEYWEPTYRKDKGNLDRIHFPEVQKKQLFKFLREQDFKKKLQDILKYENNQE